MGKRIKRECSVEGCREAATLRRQGMCATHYWEWKEAQPKPPCTICGDPVSALGLCNMHYTRSRIHGDPLFTKQIRGDIEARFWSWVDRRGDDECWPWLGLHTKAGYAHFTVGGKRVSAHRWAYERFVGPIPDGLDLDHVKANGCVRHDCTNFVSHLEPVTERENVLRGDGPSARNSRKTHCDSGHEFTPENIYRYKGRRKCRQCNREKALEHYYQKRDGRKGDAA